MKNILTTLILLAVLMSLGGCKKKETLLFCEGTTPDMKGVKCGTVFTAGDLTLLIKSGDNFETDKLTAVVYDLKEYREEQARTFSIDVKPEEQTATAPLSLYAEGKYRLRIYGKDKKNVAEGEVEIVDTY